jgi:Cyanobacterial TRADD-N associated 2-Transmembrane domain
MMRADLHADATTGNFSKLTNATVPSAEVQERRYHSQAISQANILFWFSLAVATAGFILTSYLMLSFSQAGNLQLLLKSLPGTVIEVFAVISFRQAREARQRATALYDRMRQDKLLADVMLLLDSIDDPKLRNVMKARLSCRMLDSFSTSFPLEHK